MKLGVDYFCFGVDLSLVRNACPRKNLSSQRSLTKQCQTTKQPKSKEKREKAFVVGYCCCFVLSLFL